MLSRVDLIRTDLSEELSASIIRVTTIGELGTLAVTSNRSTRLLVLKRTIPTDQQPLVGEIKWQPLRIEGCRVVNAADSHGR
jgi:hypothetical protein